MKSLSELRARLAEVMMDHIGKERAIGMGELYERVYGERWSHRINDTRALRFLITDLRRQGKKICSDGSGYYLSAVSSELEEYLRRRRTRALKELKIEAAMRNKSLPELLGQMKLEMEGPGDAAA